MLSVNKGGGSPQATNEPARQTAAGACPSMVERVTYDRDVCWKAFGEWHVKGSCVYVGAGLALIIAGCSAQRPEEIWVWSSTNRPNAEVIRTLGNSDTEATICLRADHARLQDVVQRIADHAQLPVRWDREPQNAFCTAKLTDVTPLVALRSILKFQYTVMVDTNGVILITDIGSRTKPSRAPRVPLGD
jgi:hypothetical protein